MSQRVSAAQICAAMGGRWTRGHHGTCRCPAHEDSSPSLSVSETRDGRPLVHCFAGCSQADVIAALKSRGLWGDGELVHDPSYAGQLTLSHQAHAEASKLERQRGAQDIWDKGKPAQGTPVEAYLRARGIRLPVPPELRYLSACRHTETRKSYPAMLAKLSDNTGFCAVQRTFLDHTFPKKASISPNKKTKGAMEGSAVRLRPVRDTLGIAEGIETALSACQLYSVPTWATLSANRLGKLDVPQGVRDIVIFADAGEVGRKEAFAAADIYERKGYRTEVILPAAHFGGDPDDFNAVLQERA